MIVELRIEKFAIIQRLELEFGAGLLTFTGETGAGKSIILDALETVMGGRADNSMIRAGYERAYVEATFAVPPAAQDAVRSLLDHEDLLDPGEDLRFITLSRELRANGRSSARINGRSVGVHLLRELGGLLVDIHGQSEHLSLLDVRQHLRLLDEYAGAGSLLDAYRVTYRALRALQRELFELRRAERDASARSDLLTFQAEEIEAAGLSADEEEELRQERTRLANAESLAESANQALALLDEGDTETAPVSTLFGQVVDALSSLAKIDTGQLTLAETAAQAADLIDDLTRSLRSYLEDIEYNPRRLETVEERLNLISDLKRKYGGSIDAVIAHGEHARQQLDLIAHATERISELEQEQESLLAQLAADGLALSAARKQAGEQLGYAIERELDDLRMEGARFAAEIRYEPDYEGAPLPDGQRVTFDEHGLDKVEFLIAPNPGEGLKPLVKIASGGETSRLMLALKKVLAQADDIPTLVFDEIDQGIGGRVGSVVGEKLWQLARSHQVLCITHLPQLAAFGESHYRVRKLVDSGRTTTAVDRLDGDDRLDEMALMLGGETAANRAAAQEALVQAQKRAEQLAGRSSAVDNELPF